MLTVVRLASRLRGKSGGKLVRLAFSERGHEQRRGKGIEGDCTVVVKLFQGNMYYVHAGERYPEARSFPLKN